MTETNPVIRIYCDGGMANRFGSLVSGLIAAEQYGWNPVVVWPENMGCGAALSDLFVNLPFDCFESVEPVDWPFVTHWPWEGRALFNVTDLPSLVGKNIEFNEDKLIFSKKRAIEILNKLTIHPEILDNACKFIREFNVNQSVFGLHVRGTDWADTDTLLGDARNRVKNKNQRFFVCSDEHNIEKEFNKFNHVCSLSKKHYATNCDNMVCRSKESVVEAFADMLILSRTTVIVNGSSFNNWARIYSKVNLCCS
jgi:hypothetical protein